MPMNDIECAYRGRVWIALGYESWAQWCDKELGGFKLPVPQRKEMVASLKSRGLSNRSIAEVTGVSKDTINRDIRSGGSNDPPGTKVTGQDGKSYSANRPIKPRPMDEVTPGESDAIAEKLIFNSSPIREDLEESEPTDITSLSMKCHSIKRQMREYLNLMMSCEDRDIIAIQVRDIDNILSAIKECAKSGTMDDEIQKLLMESE